jgi:(1->4)-alpha-D-glucan 1-alpha-D-glucosylmutase
MSVEKLPSAGIPVSTYRLQFNGRFTYADATKLVPYLHDLGITDIYSSPCFKTARGSVHGYDIVDANVLNPEIGGEAGLDQFVSALRTHEMGHILDIVPNHMYVESEENNWWMDVLENGPSSLYANFFDIDWSPAKKELQNKILIPILGEQYGTVLERQELRLSFKDGAFFLSYYDHRLPIAPDTYAAILTHRMERLRTLLPPDHPHMVELLSILTALGCLPAYTATDRDRTVERRREKETIKRRLAVLCADSPLVSGFLDANITSLNGITGAPESFNLLDDLLNRQVWRLSHWRVATEEINYRRFFDINGLAAIRVEDPEVFRKTHELLFRLVREGKVTGLRVDHPDGLYDPREYFRRLQRECLVQIRLAGAEGNTPTKTPLGKNPLEAEIRKECEEILRSDPTFKPFFVLGEKILTGGEKMPEDWPIFGTTGYAFLNPLNAIFIDTANARTFDKIYTGFVRSKFNYQGLVYEKKRLIVLTAMSGEINRLGEYLNYLAEKNRHTRDFTLNSLRTAIAEVIVSFPVYRTYITDRGVDERDRRYVEQAVSKAKRHNPALSGTVFDFLKRVLLLDCPGCFDEADRMEWVDFVMKFQQLTGPIMAKGLEDTVFYVYNRLISLNEVGGDPERFGTPLDAFHRQNIETIKTRPGSLVTTSTHDTKRSEDVRARLNVLSEVPLEWRGCVVRWRRFNKGAKPVVDGRPVPDRNEEYLLYQTLVGIWPLGPLSDQGYADLKGRIRDNLVKSVREAKVNSSWISPDLPYEDGLAHFVDAILLKPADQPFVRDFRAFQDEIAYLGMFNSLSQTLLKITSPGVPDFYQGTEGWDFSLVDPDNRKPVDFKLREAILKRLKRRIEGPRKNRAATAKALLRSWKDGMVKLYVIRTTLNYRRENRALFREGDYTPLVSEGRFGENVCAFARRRDGKTAIVVVPRLVTRISRDLDKPPLGLAVWENSCIAVPDQIAEDAFHNVLTSETISVAKAAGRRTLRLGEIFANFPVALLEGRTSD